MEITRKFIDDVFSSVASKYDLMNDLMSGGLHRLWKREFIKQINILPHSKILDVASGTGDIGIKILEKYSDCQVILSDRNWEMLNIANEHLLNKGLLSGILICADAENLPFPDNYFDYYTIAFGIRNVTNIKQALKEAYRVLKVGGKFICLEFSQVKNKYFSQLYDTYSYRIIPFIGEKITKNRAAYEYLVESIRNFPKVEDFRQMITAAGFDNTDFNLLTGGIVAIHEGFKYK